MVDTGLIFDPVKPNWYSIFLLDFELYKGQ